LIHSESVVTAVRRAVGPGKIAMHEPSLGWRERAAVMESLDGGVVGYDFVDRFQSAVANACGTEQSLAVSSGTAALHLALMVCGVGTNHEVIVPALTFIATANAVRYCGAFPHFVDSRESDLGIDPDKLRHYLSVVAEKREKGTFNKLTGRRIRAIIAVHLLGNPCDMNSIMEIAASYGLPVIEDAAEALGSNVNGRPCGSFGHVGAVSFNNNKIVTTNGGGALVTNDPFLQAKAWSLGTTARIAHPWLMEHTEVAWNYRMGNINAAFGLPQIERLQQIVIAKGILHQRYLDEFGDLMFRSSAGSNDWLNAIVLPPGEAVHRDAICKALTDDGISCRALFTPLHVLPFYASNPRDNLDCAESLFRRVICLPSSPKLA